MRKGALRVAGEHNTAVTHYRELEREGESVMRVGVLMRVHQCAGALGRRASQILQEKKGLSGH